MDCETLISEVFARRPIWDVSHSQHHNRGVLDKLWSQIAEHMNISVKNARLKWKYLRDQFRKELKKMPPMRSGDPASSYEPSWAYFKLLHFLKDQMEAKETTSNLPGPSSVVAAPQDQSDSDNYNEDSQIENLDLSNDITEPSNNDAQISSKNASKKACKRPLSNNDLNVRLLTLEEKKLELFAKQNSSGNQEPKSGDYHFFMSLLPFMEKFDFLQKLRIRNKIQEAITAELSLLPQYQATAVSVCSTPSSAYDSRPASILSQHSGQGLQGYNYPMSPPQNLINTQLQLQNQASAVTICSGPSSSNESRPASVLSQHYSGQGIQGLEGYPMELSRNVINMQSQ